MSLRGLKILCHDVRRSRVNPSLFFSSIQLLIRRLRGTPRARIRSDSRRAMGPTRTGQPDSQDPRRARAHDYPCYYGRRCVTVALYEKIAQRYPKAVNLSRIYLHLRFLSRGDFPGISRRLPRPLRPRFVARDANVIDFALSITADQRYREGKLYRRFLPRTWNRDIRRWIGHVWNRTGTRHQSFETIARQRKEEMRLDR